MQGDMSWANFPLQATPLVKDNRIICKTSKLSATACVYRLDPYVSILPVTPRIATALVMMQV